MNQYDPTVKNDAIERLVTKITGDDRRASVSLGFCIRPPIGCGEKVEGFRDALSEKEFTISGLCQKCQDEFFGGG